MDISQAARETLASASGVDVGDLSAVDDEIVAMTLAEVARKAAQAKGRGAVGSDQHNNKSGTAGEGVSMGSSISDDGGLAFMAQAARNAQSGGDTGRIRVRGTEEKFDTRRPTMKHCKSGRPLVRPNGAEQEGHSEWDFARLGTWVKFLARKGGAGVNWTETDEAILSEMVHKDSWHGEVNGQWHAAVSGTQAKAFLDDTTSGGSYINPTWFDTNIVEPALLSGQLAPEVDMVNVPNGSSVRAAMLTAPTLTWGSSEGTAFSVVTTDGLLDELDSTIYPVVAAVECGMDWLADTPVNIGERLARSVLERLAEEIDRVIAVGSSGSSQPTGISQAAGIATESASNGTSGPITVSDIERLCFGVGLQYRNPTYKPCFMGSDTMYRRCRAVATGISGDQTRIFGMDHQSYMLLEHPFRVQNDFSAGSLFFGSLRGYRLYRRQGVQTRWTSEGQTLALKNTSLFVFRARMGGRVVLSEAFVKMTNAAQTG